MLRVGDIMTRDVVVATPEMTLREAAELFAAHHISGAPVVSGAHVVGVVSAADILEFAASARGLTSEDDEHAPSLGWSEPPLHGESPNEVVPLSSYYSEMWSEAHDDVTERLAHPMSSDVDLLDEYTVDEIMSRPLVSLSPNEDVLSAADLMQQRALHRVIVVRDGELVGIVSTLDIVRAVANHKLLTRTYVFDHARPTREGGLGARRGLES
jgi:CBS domain-containing protein